MINHRRNAIRRRSSCLVAVFALTAGAANAVDKPAPAYTPTALTAARGLPRTPDGHPDFQGVVWDAKFFAPLQAPRAAADLVVPEAEARKAYDAFIDPILKAPFLALDPEAADLLTSSKGFPIVRGQRRSRLLVLPADGKLPLTPQALTESQARGGGNKADGPEDRNTMERCLNLGGVPPVAMLTSINPWEFVQTPEHVVIHSESGDEVRIVPFARVHGPATTRPPMGDSIARWDGDTLVVETTHFLARDRLRASLSGALIVNPEATVIERFTRLSKDELLYQFTIVDPKVYAAPWLAEYSLYRAPYRMFPSSCHEGNYGLPNILAGAREEERVATRGALAGGLPR